MTLETWFASDIGLVRKNNQDAVGCFPELQLFVLADGMGGREEGEVASQMAVDVIHRYVRGAPASWRSRFGGGPRSNDGDAETERLRGAVEQANEKIFEAGHTQPQAATRSMGTTVVVLRFALDEGKAFWAYVGDSRLYRMRGAQLVLLTADHTVPGEAYWDQVAVPLDLPHSNRLVRALGIEPEVDVSTQSDTTQLGDVFLLCSDGLSAMVKPHEIQTELAAMTDLNDTGSALIQRALSAGGRDNTSVVLVRVLER